MKRWIERLILCLIRAYQRWISPAFPRRCKYHPTCSAYAVQALRELGPFRGSIVAAHRLVRCNPWSRGGVDDLENRTLFRGTASPGPVGRPRAARARTPMRVN